MIIKPFLLAILTLVLASIPAKGHDPQHRADLNEWASGLKNQSGTPCCNGQDWEHAEAQWESDAGRYSVKIGDQWLDVPPDKMVKGQNRVGVALVWYSMTWGLNGKSIPQIRCFMPGTLS
jgi:hypothetical protein